MTRIAERRPTILLQEEQKRVLWQLRVYGPAPRTVLAERLGIHNGAMTRIARELVALGLVEEGAIAIAAARGRPVVPLRLAGRNCYAAGATAHPGWLELVLADFSGAVIARDFAPFDSGDPRVFADTVDQRMRVLVAEHHLFTSRFLGLGVAATGPMRSDQPALRWTVEWMKGWRDVDLATCIGDRLGLPVWVDNDCTLAALAEYYDLGLIRCSGSALVFFIGHGIGGGVISGRGVMGGEHGNAGEIGRLFPPGPRPSGIDLLACLRASGARIESLLDLAAHVDAHRDVVDTWVSRAGDQLAMAVDSGIAWLDPGAVVISGALPIPVLAAVAKRVERGAWATDFSHLPRPTLYVSRLGSWAVALGAALLPVHGLLADDAL